MMDFSAIKKLTIGGVALKQLFINGIQVWKSFTNQVPISTDTDGSIFNGVGYKENVRLSSSGGISSSAQNGSVTTGFIPAARDDVVRIKGATWSRVGGQHYYYNFYDSAKKLLLAYSADSFAGGDWVGVSVTYDAETGVTTFDFRNVTTTSSWYNQTKNTAFIRINAKGKGADLIVTVNEEIA